MAHIVDLTAIDEAIGNALAVIDDFLASQNPSSGDKDYAEALKSNLQSMRTTVAEDCNNAPALSDGFRPRLREEGT